MTGLEKKLLQCFEKSDEFTISDVVSVRGWYVSNYHYTIEAVLQKPVNAKEGNLDNIEVELDFNKISDLIKAFNLKYKKDFLAIGCKQVWDRFKIAAAEFNQLHIYRDQSLYTYERSGLHSLAFNREINGKNVTAKLELSNFKKLSDYTNHCENFHNKLRTAR